MTLVSILSLSGAPGVSTLACLLASTWAPPGPMAVVECDVSGGDLAARFGLSTSVGWPSLTAAVRRAERSTPLDPHLQYLPGGLPVLVGAHQGAPVAADGPEAAVVRSRAGACAEGIAQADDGAGRGSGLVVIDLGRLPADPGATEGWLEAADWTVVVVRDDPAGAVRVHDRSVELLARTAGRVGLVVVGATGFRCRELSDLTRLVPLGDIPYDPEGAAVASGASGAGRRLGRSGLLATVRRVGVVVADRTGAARAPGPAPAPGPARTPVAPESPDTERSPTRAETEVHTDGLSGVGSIEAARRSLFWPRARRLREGSETT